MRELLELISTEDCAATFDYDRLERAIFKLLAGLEPDPHWGSSAAPKAFPPSGAWRPSRPTRRVPPLRASADTERPHSPPE